EREHALDGEHRLVDHRAHLCEQIIYIEYRDAREAMCKLREHMARGRTEVRAREIGTRRRIEHAGRKHDEEIRVEAVPFDVPDARDRRRERLAADLEGQAIADAQAERSLELRGERYERLAEVLRPPPASGDHAVVRAELGGPGDVLLPPRETLAGLAPEPHRPDWIAVD